MHQDLGSLLGRWHQWRSHYSHERGYARVKAYALSHGDDDEELEQLEMRSLEEAISELPQLHQLALQHRARSECLGVEVIMLNRLPRDRTELEFLMLQAEQILLRKLVARGMI